MRAYRYVAAGRHSDATRICEALPKLRQFWHGPGDGNEGLLNCYRRSMEEAHLLDEAELARASLPAATLQARRDRLRRHHQTIRRRRRRIAAQRWYDEDGRPLVEPHQVADSIERCWAEVFRERTPDPEASEMFLQYAQ